MSAIDKNRRFYEEKVAKMIRDEFSQYESRIAVGIVGEGSDCFGYDEKGTSSETQAGVAEHHC